MQRFMICLLTIEGAATTHLKKEHRQASDGNGLPGKSKACGVKIDLFHF
jgi:hypothetical protein